jgi:SAM-dependent methyltransferase
VTGHAVPLSRLPGHIGNMTNTCRICGALDAHSLFYPREAKVGTWESYEYFQCKSCFTLQITSIPEDLSTYYSNYYSCDPPASRCPLKQWLKIRRDRYEAFGHGAIGCLLSIAVSRNAVLRPLSCLHLSADTRILDVGCGAGGLLKDLQAAGFNRLLGVDPFIKQDVFIPPGLTIRKCTLEEVHPPWDLIVINHVFEHLPEPRSVLSAVSRLLTPGGHCLVRIPTVSSYAWQKYRTNWCQLDAPRHLYLYSMGSITHLAAEFGLVPVRTVFDSREFQFYGSEKIQRGIPITEGSGGSDRSFLVSRWQRLKANYLNARHRGDSVAILFGRHYGSRTGVTGAGTHSRIDTGSRIPGPTLRRDGGELPVLVPSSSVGARGSCKWSSAAEARLQASCS